MKIVYRYTGTRNLKDSLFIEKGEIEEVYFSIFYDHPYPLVFITTTSFVHSLNCIGHGQHSNYGGSGKFQIFDLAKIIPGRYIRPN